jgi:hypothetical protein
MLTLLLAMALAQPPERPDMIVITPKPKAAAVPGSTAPVPVPAGPIVVEAEDRPGFLVVRPRAVPVTPGISPAAATGPAPNHYGSLTVIRPRGMTPNAPTAPNAKVNATGLPAPQQPTPAAAPPPAEMPEADKGKLIYETWDAVFVKQMQIGYVHTTIREFDRDGKKFLYAVKELKQTVSRFGQRVEMSEEETTFETPEGQILVYRRRQGVGRNQVLSVTGTVSGKQIVLKGEGAAAGMNESVPWPDGVIGIAKETELMKGRNLKVGESFTYQMFAGQVNWVGKYTVTMKGTEKLALYAGQEPKEYVKVESAMDPIRDKQGAVFALPASTVWHDPVTGWAVKAEFDMPPLGGLMTVTRTTKEAATRLPGQVPELFDVQSIKLNKVVADIHGLGQLTYAVTAPKDPDPTSMFARDGRQTTANVDAVAKTFELIVRSGNAKLDAVKAPDEAYLKECLGTSFYIDWNEAETKRHAQAAVAALPAAATALEKARAVEKYVRANMRATEFSQAMASCNSVAKSLSGDCTEYSMLACGMCRSLGIPARTNLGLVYAPDQKGLPYLAFHMWFDVYTDERWHALDGTLALGQVGPGHVKISDVTWHNETSMAPLLPVLRVLMARPTVEVK